MRAMSKEGPIRNLWLFYAAADLYAVVAAYYATIFMRFHSEWGTRLYGRLNQVFSVAEPARLDPTLQEFYDVSGPRIILLIAATVCFLYAFLNLYAGRRFLLKRLVAWNVILANIVALILFYSYFYARWNQFHPRTVFATIMFLDIIFCVLFRAVVYRILQWLRLNRGFDECRAVLIGSGREAERIDRLVSASRPHGIRIAEKLPTRAGISIPELSAAISESVKKCGANMIICADLGLPLAHVMSMVELSGRLGVAAKIYSKDMGILTAQAGVATDFIHGVPLVHFREPREMRLRVAFVRGLSLALAATGLLLLLPAFLLIAAIVSLTSSGPAIFVQERIGLNREPFKMFKFRTMRHLANEEQGDIEEHNESDDVMFKMKEDPRVTGIGRLLRRFSLDELPQLGNVMRGEMTLVGPRPLPRRDFEKYFEEWQYYRHSRLPGMTGLWQVSGRSDIDFPNMCILDVYYLRNEDWILDLKIMLKTVWVVLFARGAY